MGTLDESIGRKSEERISRWKENVHVLTLLTTDDDKALEEAGRLQKDAMDRHGEGYEDFTNAGIISACKEVVFNMVGGKPIFHFICYVFDPSRYEIQIVHMMDQHVDGVTDDEINDEIINTLAVAAGMEIPVYPNTEELAPVLAQYQRKLLLDGFTAPGENGERVRLRLTRYDRHIVGESGFFGQLRPCESVLPADFILAREAIVSELHKYQSGERILTSLRLAVSQLETILQSPVRNENELQRCLEQNPILFGLEYVRIIPKHQLGSEYEMDFALERMSGIIDILEIESSILPVFNRRGDPSHHLVHAEQQVFDWIEWVERNNPYAREHLPGFISPQGYVIIGRRSSSDEDCIRRLRRRNQLFGGRVIVMTYDDLLERAKNFIGLLEG